MPCSLRLFMIPLRQAWTEVRLSRREKTASHHECPAGRECHSYKCKIDNPEYHPYCSLFLLPADPGKKSLYSMSHQNSQKRLHIFLWI